MADKITKDMTFFEVMRMYPQSVQVLQKYNMGCVGCMGAQNERLEQGANAHGVDINALLADLNAAVN
jgi:hybrid cluster-associated redox disulfide protein